jgi:hypothetical protein
MSDKGKPVHADPERTVGGRDDQSFQTSAGSKPAWQAEGEYRAATGRRYRYRVEACDWDLDHPHACLFTFNVQGPGRAFEKVIAVAPREVEAGQDGHEGGGVPSDALLALAAQLALGKLFHKLDSGNEADEPTPLA